ncbi:hypothetical protein [Persicobacter diffluens]|uniref:DNA-3-methyladenine glycosylase II n=1 Tax=Persicobacter diffluens TaxID=981 RepID=A0AAN4W1D3_9BACT|nr:hypothetical protein PEDI_26720 [Persicobacter diffluens]
MKFEIKAEAIEHLQSIPEMNLLMELVPEIPEREIVPDPFLGLVFNIIYQQVSFAAGNTIYHRFLQLFEQTPDPKALLALEFEVLRSCGLSNAKAKYCREIAKAFIEKPEQFTPEFLQQLSDKEIHHLLLPIKGVGPWTIQMFLIFTLQRQDVHSYGDLALRKGMQWLFQREEMNPEIFEKLAAKFSPYNTVASFYLWEITLRQYFRFDSPEALFKVQP